MSGGAALACPGADVGSSGRRPGGAAVRSRFAPHRSGRPQSGEVTPVKST